MFPVDIAKFLKTAFFMEHLRWLLLATYHNTIKSAGLPFLWFCASMCFHFDQKLTQNVAQIILYHCMTWQFLPFLNWFITCFWFQNMFSLVAFDLDENLHKPLHKDLYNITCQKTFFSCTLPLVRGFKFQGMIWKTEECPVGKNVELKTSR